MLNNSKLIYLVPFTMLAACGGESKEVWDAPNVIVILTDDQGYGDIGVHGSPVVKTPSLDKLYGESVRLTDYHVAPMSAPTRGQMMTGCDAMHNGCTAVCEGRSMPDITMPMMPQVFKDAGYATGHFGKWHLGDSYPYRPHDRGFDVSLHFPAWGISSLADYWQNDYFDPMLRRNDELEQHDGYSTDIFFDNAMEWMSDCQKEDKPFFLYLATNTPHVPEMVAEKYSKVYAEMGKYEGKKIPDIFYGMIANIDENMAKLDKFLIENNLKENTILVFSSDNGTQNSDAAKIFNAGMRDKKGSVYEGGHRVPLFIRWNKGRLRHGEDLDQLTVAQDLYSTLLDLCGVEDIPSTDGVSLKGILTDSSAKLDDRMKVIQYGAGETGGKKWDRAVVMWNKWRLIGGDKLFNVENDPHQDHNVADQYPDIVVAMNKHYDLWYKYTKPQYDRKRYITIGYEKANPTILYSNDWNGGYCDNQRGLFEANVTGYYDIEVERAGRYEFELSRWPFEAEIAISGYSEEFLRPVKNNNSKINRDAKFAARPITAAKLKIDGKVFDLPVGSDDKTVTFNVALNIGKSCVEGLFLDKNGEELCGAMYMSIKKL